MNLKTVFMTLMSLALGPVLWSSDLRAPLEALPENSLFAVRLENSEAMRKDLSEKTKLGALLFSPERIAAYKAYFSDLANSDEGFGSFVDELEEVGLTLDDLYGIISSEFGGGMALWDVTGFAPLPMLYLWLDTEPEMAEKVFNSILKSSVDSETVTREDQQVAGLDAARIRSNQDGSSALMTRLENRFLFVIGFPSDGVYTEELGEAYEEAEVQALGSFIEAQRGNEGGFLEAFLSEDEIVELRPEGHLYLEVLGDFQKMLPHFLKDKEDLIHQLGLDQLTKFAAWSSYEDKTVYSTLFLGAPVERKGLFSLVDQEAFDFQPPLWVPADLNVYSTAAMDFQSLYEIVIEEAGAYLEPGMLEQQLKFFNTQIQQVLQTDIETIFSSFGNRLHMLEYPMEIVEIREWVGVDEIKVPAPQQSIAMVIDFDQPEILARAISFASQFAANPMSGVEVFEEQGFHGIRLSAGGAETVFAYGLGKLVFGQGSGAASKAFSLLKNSPEAEDALINGTQFREFMARSTPEEGIAFSYAYGDKQIENMISVLDFFQQSLFTEKNAEIPPELQALRDLFPEKEEFEDVLGSIFSRSYTNEDGVVAEGVTELR
ncbi:MAG: hypothetical protein JKY51_02495 [Opitutaceae bacterium]|nr:hypothetical protein [Opitutaceae bacterium]